MDESTISSGGANMDKALSYAEARATASLAVARKDYDDLHERVYRLATLLIAGAGAVGSLALSNSGAAKAVAWAPMAALALSWCGTAAWVAWWGLRSNSLSAGNSGEALVGQVEAWMNCGKSPDEALLVVRREELRLERKRLRAYCDATTARAWVLDMAYIIVAATSPTVPAITYAACRWLAP